MKLSSIISGSLLLVGLVCAITFQPQVAFADQELCPAVYPCDDAGELLAIFEGSLDPCAIKFAAQCKQIRADNRKGCSAVSEQYNKLQVESERQKTQLTKLQRKLRKLSKAKN